MVRLYQDNQTLKDYFSVEQTPNNLASYCWSIADLLRGDFRQSQYGRIILPFTLLRRLEGAALMPCSRHSSETGTPLSACLMMANIWLSEKRDFFM
jgi:hypothetical protein